MAPIRQANPQLSVIVVPIGLLDQSGAGAPPPPVSQGRFGDHILYTSGTTGTYKKLLSDGEVIETGLIERSRGILTRHLDRDGVFLALGFQPWCALGYRNPLICWHRGATVIFDQDVDPARSLHDYPVTMVYVVPSQLPMLCKALSTRPDHHPELKVQIGGGFVHVDQVRDLIGAENCTLFVSYSGTEFLTGMLTTIETAEDLVWMTPTGLPRMEIVDDREQPLPPGVHGKVRIEVTPHSPVGYLDDPEATARHFRDGYFYPGDMAVAREDGRVRILGRVEDVLNLGGKKVAVAPVEEAVREALGVENLCVFAVQDSDGQEMLVLAIEGGALPDRARLEAMNKAVLRAPRLRVSRIESFPRGENGMMKINRRKVLELARATWSN